MGPLRLGDFVGVVRGELIGPATDIEIEHPATHSSRIHSGAAFFALPGSRADGHDFVGSAARNGAAAAVVKAGRLNEEIRAAGIPIVAVDDPLRALQRLAAWWRRSLDTRFVAVVGSIGKTVTKDCLVHLLSARRPVYGTPGSYNSQLGVPLAILGCPRTAETAVIEVAVSDPGEMGRLAAVVQPDDVVLTNVGTRWRYRFADRRAQMRELLQIAADRPLVLGEADAELRAAAEEIASAVQVVGASPGLPAFTRRRRDRDADIAVTFPDGQTASLVVRTPSVEILDDVELAVSAAWRLGLDPAAIGEALADYTPTSTRMEIWPSPSGVTLVRDAATPDPMAVGAAVRAAKRLERHGGRTVVVLGPPAGTWGAQAAADLAHALVSERADEVLAVVAGADDRLVRVTDQLEGRLPVRLFAEMDELRRHLVDGLGPGDVCLVQSPPGRGIGDLSSSIAEAMAPTRLYLDLAALEENVTTFRRLVGPKVRILAMVKALAYGTDPVAMAQALAHGDDAVALTLDLQESGVDCLGVSNADEGVALRRAGVTVPILVMLGTEAELDKMVRYSLTPLLYSETMVAAVTTLAKDGV
ncbi:MAG: alanine racemase, partial [Acidimicrobiales bacterium]